MQSRLTGMGLLTNVQHPLERLGELVDAEKKRQRALVIAERWRLVRAGLAGASAGGSLFATAVVSYAMLKTDPLPVAEGGALLGPTVIAALDVDAAPPPPFVAAQGPQPEQPILWSRADIDPTAAAFKDVAPLEDVARPQAGISLQAQAIASLGEPLARDTEGMATLEPDVVVAPVEETPRVELAAVTEPIEDVPLLHTLVVSGLPEGSRVDNGVDIGDGTIVVPGDGVGDIDVKLPDRVRQPVRAAVEMLGPDGVRSTGFTLTIRPSVSEGRLPRSARGADDDDEPRKVRRKKQRVKAIEPAVARAPAPPVKEWTYSEQPSYLGRGDGERRRRDEAIDEPDTSLSRPRQRVPEAEQAPREAEGFSLFSLFGGQ